MRVILGILVSGVLHVGAVLSALIYIPVASTLGEDAIYVPVELVTLADTTNVRAARPEPEPEIEDPVQETPPAPVEEVIEPEPEIIPPEPDPVTPEPEPEPVLPEPEPEPVEPEPEPEPVTPEPEPEPQGLDLDNLSGLIDRSREQNNAGSTSDAGDARRGVGAGTAMTATLQTMAASQITPCVRSNADAPIDMDLAVTVEVRLERSGELAEAPRLVNSARIQNSPNPFLRVAGERALRAVIECAPYSLPPQNYAEWRRLEVNVDTQRGRR